MTNDDQRREQGGDYGQRADKGAKTPSTPKGNLVPRQPAENSQSESSSSGSDSDGEN